MASPAMPPLPIDAASRCRRGTAGPTIGASSMSFVRAKMLVLLACDAWATAADTTPKKTCMRQAPPGGMCSAPFK